MHGPETGIIPLHDEIAWCRKWVARAKELDAAEHGDALTRHPKVARLTKGKRLLLAKEILEDIQFENVNALKLLSEGGTLAGKVEPSPLL